MNIVSGFRSVAVVLSLACASASLLVSGCASTTHHEGTGEYVDDVVITTKVRAAILEASDLKVLEIKVETFKGRVQLSGFVHTQAEIDHAGRLARGIRGVTSVVNDIRIK